MGSSQNLWTMPPSKMVNYDYQGETKRQINTGSALSLQTVLADLADSSALIPRS